LKIRNQIQLWRYQSEGCSPSFYVCHSGDSIVPL